jgi:hypothetical protein
MCIIKYQANIMKTRYSHKIAFTLTAISLSMVGNTANAATISWADWTGSNSGAVTGAFTAQGTITTPTDTVSVTYSNPQGIAFYNASGGTDYWQNAQSGRNPATSPYTSTFVDNIPTGTDIVGLQFAGTQTLAFSKTIANPVFSYVSLNGNGYAFDRDFDILSFGDPSDGNTCGYWGCGTSSKSIVDIGGGVLEYRLLGTGEPHGTIKFTGAFDTVSWRSLSSENWNGFTVGVEGTAAEVLPTSVPEPSNLISLGMGIVGFCTVAKKRISKGMKML